MTKYELQGSECIRTMENHKAKLFQILEDALVRLLACVALWLASLILCDSALGDIWSMHEKASPNFCLGGLQLPLSSLSASSYSATNQFNKWSFNYFALRF